jgi:hypothetical protein
LHSNLAAIADIFCRNDGVAPGYLQAAHGSYLTLTGAKVNLAAPRPDSKVLAPWAVESFKYSKYISSVSLHTKHTKLSGLSDAVILAEAREVPEIYVCEFASGPVPAGAVFWL